MSDPEFSPVRKRTKARTNGRAPGARKRRRKAASDDDDESFVMPPSRRVRSPYARDPSPPLRTRPVARRGRARRPVKQGGSEKGEEEEEEEAAELIVTPAVAGAIARASRGNRPKARSQAGGARARSRASRRRDDRAVDKESLAALRAPFLERTKPVLAPMADLPPWRKHAGCVLVNPSWPSVLHVCLYPGCECTTTTAPALRDHILSRHFGLSPVPPPTPFVDHDDVSRLMDPPPTDDGNTTLYEPGPDKRPSVPAPPPPPPVVLPDLPYDVPETVIWTCPLCKHMNTWDAKECRTCLLTRELAVVHAPPTKVPSPDAGEPGAEAALAAAMAVKAPPVVQLALPPPAAAPKNPPPSEDLPLEEEGEKEEEVPAPPAVLAPSDGEEQEE